MGYRDGPLVLKGLSFSVSPKHKVGVVGRTGSGKSSLMIALFRIENVRSGAIYIDGVDISKIRLNVLRNVLGIIPQVSFKYSVDVLPPLIPMHYCCADRILLCSP
jgi:ABC-type multidrug transport system fused ATPase/permease subunit